jgi:hypothetical protein
MEPAHSSFLPLFSLFSVAIFLGLSPSVVSSKLVDAPKLPAEGTFSTAVLVGDRCPMGTLNIIAFLQLLRRIVVSNSQIQGRSYFTTGGLPPVSSSWRQAP